MVLRARWRKNDIKGGASEPPSFKTDMYICDSFIVIIKYRQNSRNIFITAF